MARSIRWIWIWENFIDPYVMWCIIRIHVISTRKYMASLYNEVDRFWIFLIVYQTFADGASQSRQKCKLNVKENRTRHVQNGCGSGINTYNIPWLDIGASYI